MDTACLNLTFMKPCVAILLTTEASCRGTQDRSCKQLFGGRASAVKSVTALTFDPIPFMAAYGMHHNQFRYLDAVLVTKHHLSIKGLKREALCPCAGPPETLTVSVRR